MIADLEPSLAGGSENDRVLVSLDEREQIASDIFFLLIIRLIASVQLFVAFPAANGSLDRLNS